jgi:hypothetical protein
MDVCSVMSKKITTDFLKKNWGINIAISIFLIVIAAYGVEIVLSFSFQSKFSPSDIDTRTSFEVLDDLRSKGVDAWPTVRSTIFIKSNGLLSGNNRIFPLGGISQKTIVYCNQIGQQKILESDEHGFDNPKGLYKNGVINAALVGDYFAFGRCGMSGEDLGSRLQNMGITSLNLENGNNGPLSDLAILKEYVEAIRPEIVLWVYFEGNDLRDLDGERTASMLMRYLEDGYSQNLLERQVEIDTILVKYITSQHLTIEGKRQIEDQLKEKANLLEAKRIKPKIIRLWHLRNSLGLINKTYHEQTNKRITNYKSQLPLFSEVLATAYKRTSDWGGKFYFVYIPAMDRYTNDNDNGALFDRDDVLASVHKLGIPVIDFHEALKKLPDPLSFNPFLTAGYNAQSYKLVSELIVSRLKKDGLMSRE